MSFVTQPRKIAVDKQSNIYIAADDETMVLLKYDSSGTQKWVKRFEGTMQNGAVTKGLAVDKNNNAIILGGVSNYGTNDDFCTVKCKPNGDTSWLRYFSATNVSGFENPYGLDVDKNGNVIVAGQSLYQLSIVKYDSNGVKLWDRLFTSVNVSGAREIGFDNLGNIVVVGGCADSLGGIGNWLTTKYNAGGTLKWYKRYYGPGPYSPDAAKIVRFDKDNNVIVGGNDNGILRDICTIKYDSLGNQKWVRRYNGLANQDDWLEDIFVDKNNDIYITGTIFDSLSWSHVICTIKYDKNGNTKWTVKYPNYNCWANACNIYVKNDSNIFIFGGVCFGLSLPTQLVLIKYHQLVTGINIISQKNPGEYKLFQNYPNPFNPVTKINYQLPKDGRVKLVIYDILGREIKTLVNELKQAGKYIVEFNGTHFASGVYFYRIQVEGGKSYTAVKKMVLIK
jgi:hypothetical protein